MDFPKLLNKIVSYIQEKHKCHTIILYGSHARGEADATSDYDIIAIRKKGDFERDCRIFKGFYLDVFIYSEAAIKKPDVSLIRIIDGVVLCQKQQIGSNLLKKIKNIFQKGAPKTPVWEKHEISSWLRKMLTRAKIEDIEGNFRRHWLLHDVLECYFKLRDMWFLGQKQSFQWLKKNDLVTYKAFEKALVPMTNIKSIERLINRVIR